MSRKRYCHIFEQKVLVKIGFSDECGAAPQIPMGSRRTVFRHDTVPLPTRSPVAPKFNADPEITNYKNNPSADRFAGVFHESSLANSARSSWTLMRPNFREINFFYR